MSSRPRALIVSYHFPPELTPGSFRAHGIALGLARLDWDVTVLTAAEGSDAGRDIRVIRVESPLPLVARAPLPAPLAERLRILWNDNAIPDRHVGWARPLAAAVRRLSRERPFDAVLSTSPPHSTHAALVGPKREFGFAWAADFRDPWTTPSRYPRTRLATELHRRIEKRVLAAADAVLANTPGNRAALVREFAGVPPERIVVVPNGFDDRMLDVPAGSGVEAADLTYAGEVYKGMMHVLADALEFIHQRGAAALPTVSVYGTIDPRESRLLASKGLSEVLQPHGVVSFEESLAAMQRARALLLLLPQGGAWASCVPSKLYPYLAARRPILALVPEGDAAETIRATGTGLAVTSTDAETAAGAIMGFVARVRDGTFSQTRNEALVREYAMSRIVGRIDGMLRHLISQRHAD